MKPHLQTTVWTLLEAGASQREIHRVTGIDRKTIRGDQKWFATAAAANSLGVAKRREHVVLGRHRRAVDSRPGALVSHPEEREMARCVGIPVRIQGATFGKCLARTSSR